MAMLWTLILSISVFFWPIESKGEFQVEHEVFTQPFPCPSLPPVASSPANLLSIYTFAKLFSSDKSGLWPMTTGWLKAFI